MGVQRNGGNGEGGAEMSTSSTLLVRGSPGLSIKTGKLSFFCDDIAVAVAVALAPLRPLPHQLSRFPSLPQLLPAGGS